MRRLSGAARGRKKGPSPSPSWGQKEGAKKGASKKGASKKGLLQFCGQCDGRGYLLCPNCDATDATDPSCGKCSGWVTSPPPPGMGNLPPPALPCTATTSAVGGGAHQTAIEREELVHHWQAEQAGPR